MANKFFLYFTSFLFTLSATTTALECCSGNWVVNDTEMENIKPPLPIADHVRCPFSSRFCVTTKTRAYAKATRKDGSVVEFPYGYDVDNYCDTVCPPGIKGIPDDNDDYDGFVVEHCCFNDYCNCPRHSVTASSSSIQFKFFIAFLLISIIALFKQ